jgi:hypothetical protein
MPPWARRYCSVHLKRLSPAGLDRFEPDQRVYVTDERGRRYGVQYQGTRIRGHEMKGGVIETETLTFEAIPIDAVTLQLHWYDTAPISMRR